MKAITNPNLFLIAEPLMMKCTHNKEGTQKQLSWEQIALQ